MPPAPREWLFEQAQLDSRTFIGTYSKIFGVMRMDTRKIKLLNGGRIDLIDT